MDTIKETYSPREMAKICNLSHATITNYCNKGEISHQKSKLNQYIKIPRSSVIEFMKRFNIPISQLISRDNKQPILIVEDNHNDYQEIETIIREDAQEPISIEGVDNGFDALIKIGESLPEIIILDINIPEMNGLELLKRIKANTSTCLIHIIVVTGYQDIKTKRIAMSHGATAFYTKPIDRFSFSQCLNTILHHAASLKKSC